MTDITSLLGAVQSPPDPKDYQFVSLLTPDQQAIVLPPRFRADPVPPRIAQVGGTCTAASSTYMRLHQQKKDLGAWLKLDYQWLYREEKKIDGIPGEGSTLRAAMRVLRGKGQALLIPGGGEPAKNRISTYYAIPASAEALKRAIFTYGGIVMAGPWAETDFHPEANGVLKAPKKNTPQAGGHAFYALGYDDGRQCDDGTRGAVLCLNTWPLPWGYNGTGVFFYPYSRVSDPDWGIWEAWKAIDLQKS